MSHILLVKDTAGERELLLVDRMVVGRDPRCDISVADAQMSRRHAEFLVSERAVTVRDLNSRNGILVNGRKMLEAVLHPGDVVQVAGLAITFLRAGAEPEAVSMPPVSGSRPAGDPATPRPGQEVQPALPFRVHVPDDDKTGLMSPDEVAAAAIASLSGRRGPTTDAQRTTVNGSVEPGTVNAAAGNGDPATVGAAAPSLGPGAVGSQTIPETPVQASTHAPVPAQPPVAPAPPVRASARTEPAAPVLVEKPPVPITEVAEAGWTASVTWQVATLAIACFMVGAVSALPWHIRPAVGPGTTAVIVLLVPLVALLAAVGLGLAVAARVRRVTLSRLSVLSASVRHVGDGSAKRVRDPLGTGPSAELAEAINEALDRARHERSTANGER